LREPPAGSVASGSWRVKKTSPAADIACEIPPGPYPEVGEGRSGGASLSIHAVPCWQGLPLPLSMWVQADEPAGQPDRTGHA
jgi:hypothetical protein